MNIYMEYIRHKNANYCRNKQTYRPNMKQIVWMLLQKWQIWTARVFRTASWVMATYAACGQQLLEDLSGDECLSVIVADLRHESLSSLMALRRRDTEKEQITSPQEYNVITQCDSAALLLA